MKKIFLFIPTILILLNSCAQTNNKESFEGIITYKISVESNTENEVYNDYQKQKYGDTLKVYITKDGSFKREYLNSGIKGFSFFNYNSSTNKSYTKWKNIDTIYSFNCKENSLSLLNEKKIKSESIMGQECLGYLISAVSPKGGQQVSLSYFYPKDKEYINPTLYENYNDFFYNKIIEEMKAPFYKLIMNMGNYIVTFEIVKIEPKEIQKEVLTLPSTIPIK